MLDAIRGFVYVLIQIALFPISFIGYFFFVGQMIVHARKTGQSATVLASLTTRYLQHHFGVRSDAPGARMMRLMPNVSLIGLDLITVASRLGHLLTGYVPKKLRYPYTNPDPSMNDEAQARTTFFDQLLERELPTLGQFVMLGAGVDTRAYRLPADSRVRCFEVDMPRNQAMKRAVVAKAGVDDSRVTYVPADFMTEDWYEKLLAAGFDPTQRSLFTWEGVTPYLSREAVEATLQRVARTAPGSRIAYDYFSSQHIGDQSAAMRYVQAVLRWLGEPFIWGIDHTPPERDRMAAFVESCGLKLEYQLNIGKYAQDKPARGGFAIAAVPS